ncbi:HlyD family secretion protein [Selenomonas bovis]|uniref:HlyD family secretion protein n=1 Tax=Selenomonas bovis TaxID=416586 RepID=UPI000376172C|nr:efflux RND transporter periplasmic adaptor subunit [Selenomonas bovis]
MEVDITEKVKRVLKFGPLALVALAILCALGVWAYQHSQKGLTVYDAKVASTMVGVKAKADGTITELVVQDGDHVEAGDVIARVQVKITDEQIAQLAQNAELAKQNLAQVQRGQTVTVPQSAAPAPMPVPQSSGNSQAVANARARLNRMNELYEMGAISAVKRDQAAADLAAAEAAATPAPAVSAPAATRYQTMTQPANPEAVKQAELAVKQAEAALENAKQDAQATEIVAPVSGTVYLGDDIQEGADLKAGATVASIGDASNIWVEARLSPNQKGKIRLGQFVSYTIEGKKYQGTVLDIVDPADAQPDTAASGSLPAASEEKDEAVQTSSISEDAGNVSGDETEDSKPGNTEGNAPDMSDGRLIVKVSLPKDMADTLRPGTDAVVRFSSAN